MTVAVSETTPTVTGASGDNAAAAAVHAGWAA